jgi:hypothetical protein
VQITGLAGDTQDVSSEALEAFAADLEGSLLYPGDEGFAEA